MVTARAVGDEETAPRVESGPTSRPEAAVDTEGVDEEAADDDAGDDGCPALPLAPGAVEVVVAADGVDEVGAGSESGAAGVTWVDASDAESPALAGPPPAATTATTATTVRAAAVPAR
jgi:hypothetical protein